MKENISKIIKIKKHKENPKLLKEIEGRSSILMINPASEMDQSTFLE
ncbi:hypothetical protein F383_35321 [Gossypium arboreum]|uniref:Uncharacterized protein n=1 Tax=Gossypium arboreum TaxID=29729 RepID=A0A0B0N5Y0_GOSAR|nr:hypothetical protein F383_35321 [Gossypium arboreum]